MDMTSVLLEFAMFPTSDDCREGSSVSKQVSKIIKMIDNSGFSYKLTPMGTIVETTSIKEALEIVERAYNELEECDRIYSILKFDIRKNYKNRLKQKVESIKKRVDLQNLDS
jgi:uncharacterized protein (TIGR00106 family)